MIKFDDNLNIISFLCLRKDERYVIHLFIFFKKKLKQMMHSLLAYIPTSGDVTRKSSSSVSNLKKSFLTYFNLKSTLIISID
jgi:hypothetical protein